MGTIKEEYEFDPQTQMARTKVGNLNQKNKGTIVIHSKNLNI